MLHALNELLAPAAMERLTLVVNHVLRTDPQAAGRLAAHAGRCIDVAPSAWPGWLPAWPRLAFRITPAGLMEWCGLAGVDAPDLKVRIDAGQPTRLVAQTLNGEAPAVEIEGDAALAGEIHWLLQHVRWDVAADLERFFGPVVAHGALQGRDGSASNMGTMGDHAGGSTHPSR
jgi:ubiquinone biosynthesis accessory factor UbiJ